MSLPKPGRLTQLKLRGMFNHRLTRSSMTSMCKLPPSGHMRAPQRGQNVRQPQHREWRPSDAAGWRFTYNAVMLVGATRLAMVVRKSTKGPDAMMQAISQDKVSKRPPGSPPVRWAVTFQPGSADVGSSGCCDRLCLHDHRRLS